MYVSKITMIFFFLSKYDLFFFYTFDKLFRLSNKYMYIPLQYFFRLKTKQLKHTYIHTNKPLKYLGIKSHSGLRDILWASMGVKMFTPSISLYVSVVVPLQSLNKIAGIGPRQVGVFSVGFLEEGGGIITYWILLYTESSTSNCLRLNIYSYGWQLANYTKIPVYSENTNLSVISLCIVK